MGIRAKRSTQSNLTLAYVWFFSVVLILPAHSSASTASQLREKLLGWWNFDGQSAIIQDQSNYRHNGSTNASRSGDAVCGRSLSFQGNKNGGYATIANAPHLNFHSGSQSFSLSIWLKLQNYEHIGQPIALLKKGTSAAYDNTVTLSLSAWASGVEFSTATDANWDENASIYSPLNDNRWHHMVYAKSHNTATLYIDGKQVNKNLIGTLPAYAGQSAFTVGRPEAGGTAISFPGLIDEFTVFSHTLSRDQVSWLRQNPCALNDSSSGGANNVALERTFQGSGHNQTDNKTFSVAITHSEIAAEQKIEFTQFSPNNTAVESQCLPQRLGATLVDGRASVVTALPDTLPSCSANEGTIISVSTTISADKKTISGSYFTSNGGFGSFNANLISTSSLNVGQTYTTVSLPGLSF